MLLYLSSNENVNTFDFLYDEHGIIIKKLSGSFSFKQFVIYDIRSLNHYNYVAIDLKALKDLDIDIIEAINAFKKMYSSRLIFYIEDIKHHEKLIVKLIDEGVYNIVASDEVNELKAEILKAISDLGISKREIQSKLSQEKDFDAIQYSTCTFVKNNIRIAVTGTQNRVGTTTMAINFANYLANNGAKVCYIEANKQKHLNELPEFYQGMTVKEDSIIYNGVKYLSLHAECHDDFDFIIYDMGIATHKVISAISKNCDAVVLCTTGKPYELKQFEQVKKLMNIDTTKHLFSFIAESDKTKLEKRYGKVYFSNYTPDYFDGDVNEMIWEDVLNPFIKR